MNKRLLWKAVLLAVMIATVSVIAFGEPNQPVAPYEGACGYMPYVTSPPYYWTGTAVSYAQCQIDLQALIARVQGQGFTIVEAYCRPAKYCA